MVNVALINNGFVDDFPSLDLQLRHTGGGDIANFLLVRVIFTVTCGFINNLI